MHDVRKMLIPDKQPAVKTVMKRHKTTDFYKTKNIFIIIIINSLANPSTKSFILYSLQLLGEDMGKGKILTIPNYPDC